MSPLMMRDCMDSNNTASAPTQVSVLQKEGVTTVQSPPSPTTSTATPSLWHRIRHRVTILLIVAALVIGVIFAIPIVTLALNTISTDDAYVNGHVTFVAPRVSGQIKQ